MQSSSCLFVAFNSFAFVYGFRAPASLDWAIALGRSCPALPRPVYAPRRHRSRKALYLGWIHSAARDPHFFVDKYPADQLVETIQQRQSSERQRDPAPPRSRDRAWTTDGGQMARLGREGRNGLAATTIEVATAVDQTSNGEGERCSEQAAGGALGWRHLDH